MNRLAAELVKGILGEAEVPRREVIGMFGGGFKPPTVGHLEVVQRAINENPELDKLIVLVGSGERDSITQEESLTIWRIYQKYLPTKVEVQPAPEGKAPISAVYSYAKNNPDKDVYWFLGAREGNEEDSIDIIKRTKSLQSGNYPNVTVKKILTGGTVSGTKTRKALLARDKEIFVQALPDIPEVDQIWNMLSDSMNLLEIGIKLKNFTGQVNPGDTISAVKGAYVYGGGKKNYLKRRKVFKVVDNDRLGVNRYRLHLEDPQGRKFFIHNYEMDGEYKGKKIPKWSMVKNTPIDERIAFTPDFVTQGDVEFIDDFADRKLAPIDVDLTGNHFFDRLNDPRNRPDISVEELEEFFDKLSDEKEEFIEFLRKYKDVVVKDTDTNINIPFMKRANKAIAKTIMRKKNFMTSNKVLPLEEGRYDNEAKMQSRYIINLFKAEFGNEFVDPKAGEGNIGDKKYILRVAFTPESLTSGASFEVDGYAQPKNITIGIKYNPEFFPEAYNELIASVKATVRHELEHFGQYHFDKDADVNVPEEGYSSRFEYLTDDYETAAYVQGLYKKAKTKKVPFTDVLEDFLDDELDVLSPEEIKLVRNQYMWYAKNNLPAAQINEADPKKGTGKKPKGSGRRLYTDEDPSDTVKIKFSTRQDIVDTLNKTSFKNKSHARQSQVINLIHQRVRAAYNRAKKPEVKKRLKTALDYITKRKEASKAKTKRLQAQKKKKKANENVAPNHNQKAAPYGSGYKKMEEGDTYEKMAAKGKKSGNLKQGTVRKRLNIPKGEKVPMYKIDKEISRLKKMDKDKDKKGVQLGDKNQKYYKALQLAKTLKSTTNLKEDLNQDLAPQIASLTQYMESNGLDLKPYPKVKFIDNDAENANNLLGRTAYYDPNQKLVALYTMGRHPKDILRSYAHELIHHHQNLNGTLDHSQTTNTNEDDALDRIEREAYENGNILFRNWEDSIKNQ